MYISIIFVNLIFLYSELIKKKCYFKDYFFFGLINYYKKLWKLRFVLLRIKDNIYCYNFKNI